MLDVLWIALIGTGAFVVLLTVGFLVHGRIVRKRHQQHLDSLNQDLQAYHRTRLSAYDTNYAHVGPPQTNPRSSQEVQQIHSEWSALGSQDHLEEEAAVEAASARPDTNPMPPKSKRKKSLRDSIYGHSGSNAPKTRRQKKIDNTIALKAMNRSPLSAITELTDSTAPLNELPMPVELPTEPTPKLPAAENEPLVSPIHSRVGESFPSTKKRPPPLSPVEIDTPISLKRESSFGQSQEPQLSPGMASVSEAPDSPLPPLPTFESCKASGPRRSSQVSTLTVDSSVLGFPSPSELSLPQVNSGMQEFDFGFNRSKPPLAPSPGRPPFWHSGGLGVPSVVPTFEYHSRETSAAPEGRVSALKTGSGTDVTAWSPGPDFFFGSQYSSPAQHRHSIQGPRLSKRSHEVMREGRQIGGNVSPTALRPRPASIASSKPFRDNQPIRSVSRGHRRQNCVRISIPVVPPSRMNSPNARSRRPSDISEASEDSDEDGSALPNKVQVVDVSPKESPDTRPRVQTRRSIVDENGSPIISSVANRSTLASSQQKRSPSPTHSSPSDERREFEDLWTQPGNTSEDYSTPDLFANPSSWALSPTPTSARTLGGPFKSSVFEHPNSENSSPILPSPCKPAPVVASAAADTTGPTTARPLGPRQAPAFPSTNVNLHRSLSKISSPATSPKTMGPVRDSHDRRRSSTTLPNPTTVQSDDQVSDLRQSVTLLRSLDSNGRLLNTNSRLWGPEGTPKFQTEAQNHEDWKQLNALWEVSRTNSVASVSTRATPVIHTRNNSTAGTGSAMHSRMSSMGPGGSMFGSTKRKMNRPQSHKRDFSISNTLPPIASRPRSSLLNNNGSPSRDSQYSLGGVSIWEDDSIHGDSPEPASGQASRRGSVAIPPRLESLPQQPVQPQAALQQQEQLGRTKQRHPQQPIGLGIIIPPLAYKPPSQPLGPSPTQKELMTRYFGDVDWSTGDVPTENLAVLPTPTSPTPLVSPISAKPVSGPGRVSMNRVHRRGRSDDKAVTAEVLKELELQLKLDEAPPTPPSEPHPAQTQTFAQYSRGWAFPMPGSGSRPGSRGQDQGQAQKRKVSPAQQRLKDDLRERAARVTSGMAAPGPQRGAGGAGGPVIGFATPPPPQQQQQPREQLKQGPQQQQQGWRPRTRREDSLRSPLSAAGSLCSTNSGVDGALGRGGSSSVISMIASAGASVDPGVGTGAGSESVRTTKSFYDVDGFLKEDAAANMSSPLGGQGRRFRRMQGSLSHRD
ncbi:uncharacterized protein HMPREF1541_10326 [Cyphellophora europaea CBS 101466]|uniref:Uncharacterized protein n=1 Tax=Cyphellophora europaea (strain CBS 101466) TaxID=1220924 RepID=W2S7H2_CYPE1|nr:uncharacterized protein HMPREF1541_10326 [Cyphellophora europaea CBS 101466]ETN44656.1 hypothetical protein HMPREF1541_10326 [Cyphellophora europaea CBS 101466]